MPILDYGKPLEQLLPIMIRFHRRQGAIQIGRVSLIAVVLVPRRIRLR